MQVQDGGVLHIEKNGCIRDADSKIRQSSDGVYDTFCFDNVWGSASGQTDVFEQVYMKHEYILHSGMHALQSMTPCMSAMGIEHTIDPKKGLRDTHPASFPLLIVPQNNGSGHTL